MDIISVEDLSFGYTSDLVLEDVNFKVKEGEFVCLVGGNGSGKSTLMKLILGELHPSKGKIKLFETDSEKFRNYKDIGYVPQVNVMSKISFPITCREIVVLNLYRDFGPVKIPRKKHYKVAEEQLRSMGLGQYLRTPFNELSGGLQQRTMISRALINNPRLLILDEPTAGVDPASKDKFFDLLDELKKTRNITVVLVTHEIELVREHVALDKIFTIVNGGIVDAGI